MKESDE